MQSSVTDAGLDICIGIGKSKGNTCQEAPVSSTWKCQFHAQDSLRTKSRKMSKWVYTRQIGPHILQKDFAGEFHVHLMTTNP